jgi:hypothetical protein
MKGSVPEEEMKRAKRKQVIRRIEGEKHLLKSYC